MAKSIPAQPRAAERLPADQGRKSERTRRLVLNAAARVFKERGYAGTRLEDIAEAAEMRAASLYYHFDSKEKLLGEVLDLGIQGMYAAVSEAVAALPPEADFRARLHAAVHAHLDMLLRQGDYTAANIRCFGHVPAEMRQAHWHWRERYGDFWRDLLAAGQRSGGLAADLDLGLLRMLLLGALNWAIEWYDAERQPLERIAALVVRIVLDGVAGTAAAAPQVLPLRRREA